MKLKLFILTSLMIMQFGGLAIAQDKQSSNATPVGNLYIFESDGNNFNTKTFFYDTGTEVVAFDTQFTSEAAKKAIEFLHSKTKNPLTYAVITHPNPDKFNGAGVFKQEGAQIVASDATVQNMPKVHEYKKNYFVNVAKMFTEQTYPALAVVDITFKDDYEIDLKNGENIRLVELNMPGVSTNQTVAFVPFLKALLVGDLVHHKVHAWLEGPIVDGTPQFSTTNWIQTLKKVDSLFPPDTTVYGGRGEAVDLKTAVSEQVSYLEKAQTIVRDYVNSLEGATLEDRKAKVNYQDLTKLFAKEFPNYGLDYMITYGAYGLVKSL